LHWAAIALAAILLLATLLVFFALGTEMGGRLLISIADHPRTPLVAGEFSGRLGRRFELRNVRVTADSLPIEARVERLAVTWHPFGLARKRLKIDRIEVVGVDVKIRKDAPGAKREPAPADSTPIKIELPLAIELGELRIERGRVTAPGDIAADIEELRASGSLDAYTIEAVGKVSAPKINHASVALKAEGGADHANGSLRVGALDGTLTLDGRAGWSPAVSWDAAVAIDRMTPGKLLTNPQAWPGVVSLRARSEGRLVDGQPHAQVELESLNGTLRGHPLAGTAELALGGRRLDIEAVDLSWGAAGLRLEGRVEETIDLAFSVDTSDLGVALPGASGSVRVNGRAGGSRTAPRLDVELAGNAVAIAGNRIGAFSGHVAADLSDAGTNDISLIARAIEAAGQKVDSLAVGASGQRKAHEVVVHGRGDSLGLRVDLAMAGGIVDSTWQGKMTRLDIASRDSGEWGLAAPAEVRAARGAAAINGFCFEPRGGLEGGEGVDSKTHLCVDGSWAQAGGGKGKVEIIAMPLSLLQPFLPELWSMRGALDMNAQVAVDADTRIQGDAALAIEGGELTLALGDTTDTIGFGTQVEAKAGSGGVRADFKGDLTRAGAAFGNLAGEVSLPKLTHLSGLSDTLAPQPLSGNLRIDFEDLGPLALLSSDMDSLAGHLTVNADAGGDLRRPDVKAEAVLNDGRVNVPEAGLELRDIEINARGDTSRKLDVDGSLRSGTGDLRFTAKSTLVAGDSLRMEARIEGQRFTVMNSPEVEVVVSPDLEAHAIGRQVEVQGEVGIPYARIEPKEIPPNAQSPSKDVRFIDAEAKAVQPPFDVTAAVRVALGDSVSFRGFGFSARFDGGLQVIESPGQPTSGTGELRVVNGTYKAYGQDLHVGTWGDSLSGERDPGRIIFAGGPIDNPGLNMRAFREAEDGTIAGLHILGTAKVPEITLFSEPSMADSDVLSYILVGHKAGEGSDSNMLADAAVSMGLKSGNVMARSLGSKVGLDETGIESEGGLDEATLVTGKYLSPKLYVGYGYGLFDQLSTFRTRYLVSKQFTVQAETGAGSGGDVLYRLERGR
jgi:translocation and assembly module TamB